MIVEGLLTTLNADGSVRIAPMGPRVDPQFLQLMLRPFPSSASFANLQRSGQGVFHVTDDVWLLAQTAVGEPDPLPPLLPAPQVQGLILADACRWYALRVASIDTRSERAEVRAQVVAAGVQREFLGFNRARHAVVEAAILATRVHLLPPAELRQQFAWLRPLVDKTGGPREQQAFDFLSAHVEAALARRAEG
jgi:hypothetical protein